MIRFFAFKIKLFYILSKVILLSDPLIIILFHVPTIEIMRFIQRRKKSEVIIFYIDGNFLLHGITVGLNKTIYRAPFYSSVMYVNVFNLSVMYVYLY